MAQVVVRNLEDSVKLALEQRATAHGWSIEEEVLRILRQAVAADAPAAAALGSRITTRFAGRGLVQDLPELRNQITTAVDLDA